MAICVSIVEDIENAVKIISDNRFKPAGGIVLSSVEYEYYKEKGLIIPIEEEEIK